MARKEKIISKTWAASSEDLKLIAELKAHFENVLGIVSDTAILRMGLRKLAEQEGLQK